MTELIQVSAWGETECSLSHEQAAQLEALDFVAVFARPSTGNWLVKADSKIGVAYGDDWELRVNPHVPVPKLFFLLAYAADPSGGKTRPRHSPAQHSWTR